MADARLNAFDAALERLCGQFLAMSGLPGFGNMAIQQVQREAVSNTVRIKTAALRGVSNLVLQAFHDRRHWNRRCQRSASPNAMSVNAPLRERSSRPPLPVE